MGFFSRLFGGGTRGDDRAQSPTGQYKLADVYVGLREKVLAIKPDDVGAAGHDPIAVLMETGYPEAVVTLAVFADGTTSLYFSNGGGLLGSGAHAAVREAALEYLRNVAAVADQLEPTVDCPLPQRERVRFFVVGSSGVRTVEASEQDLGNNRHPLSPIFHLAHAVIAAVREHAPPVK